MDTKKLSEIAFSNRKCLYHLGITKVVKVFSRGERYAASMYSVAANERQVSASKGDLSMVCQMGLSQKNPERCFKAKETALHVASDENA